MRIEPAELAFDSEGTPYSSAYGDVYHSAESGPGQAQHVFVAGNDLPRRWAQARVFTILETGFGLGLNFLATWRQWRDDPARPQRLHYVSIEKHPFERGALAALHSRYGEFAPLAQQLQDAWPPLVAGMHRLHFEDERLTLTLAFGDALELMPRLRLRADAIYLDGFAPRLNQDMWSPQLLRRLARLARPGATVATYSSAALVREGLEAAGFAVEKCPGFGRKRDMLRGSYAPRRPQAEVDAPGSRQAIVIGAGIAGAAISERLARRGWRIDLIESRALPATPRAGEVRGRVSPAPFARRLHSVARRAQRLPLCARALARAGALRSGARLGALRRAAARRLNPRRQARMIAAIAALGFPADFAQCLERGAAEALAGCALAGGGWWFPGAGWMRPASLIAAQLAAAGPALRAHFGARVETITHSGGDWQALAADGKLIAAAPVLVLANSNDTTRLASVAQALQRTRGQISYVPEADLQAPRIVLTGAGYVLPAADGVVVTGSTYDRDDDDPEPQLRGHEANLLRLAQLLPQARVTADAARLERRSGFSLRRAGPPAAHRRDAGRGCGAHEQSRRSTARSWPICRGAPGFTAPRATPRAGWSGRRWPARCWPA